MNITQGAAWLGGCLFCCCKNTYICMASHNQKDPSIPHHFRNDWPVFLSLKKKIVSAKYKPFCMCFTNIHINVQIN